MSLLSEYLEKVRFIHGAPSTPELSFYNALAELLNEVGKEQEPPVQCVMNLKDTGAGLPDGGLFTENQLPESTAPLFEGQMEAPPPARGAIEVKPADQSIEDLQQSEQVERYLDRYGTVLITNYRQFRLLSDGDGATTVLERFTLAESEQAFRELAANPDQVDAEREERFSQFLERVMAHGAPLAHPEDVAWLLASYAQDARLRLGTSSLEDLQPLREALETALGVNFQGEKGEHFFRSTIIQTLFYGVFSAWVLWHREDPTREDRFDWKDTAELLRVPVLQTLFHQLVAPGQLRALRILELMNWTGDALNRVDRPTFFERFSKEEAVQYFYEPFLEAFDDELREDLGVWYTPREIVKYQVRRVDTVLKEELEITDGLADNRVKILDPCCGTGAYLVETLNFLEERFQEQGAGNMHAGRVKEAATSRIYGFEILTAPFVVSHLQLGLTLAEMGVPLEDEERASVYLTNALTGWEPPEEPQKVLFPDLAREREEADTVKQEEDILVVFGNPPYDGFTGVAPEDSEERELSEAYTESPDGVPDKDGQGLNDLYVRFYRMAERQITERRGKGVVSYISNYRWLDGLSHPGMRAHYLEAFDRIWIDNLHGDRKMSERNPEGLSSETVFSIQGQSPGIRVGTAISLLCRSGGNENCLIQLEYRDFHQAKANERRQALLESLSEPNRDERYELIQPSADLGLPFKPRTRAENFTSWPKLTELFPYHEPGIITARDPLLVDVDRNQLEERMQAYFNPDVSNEQMEDICPVAMEETDRFSATEEREQLLERGYRPDYIVRYNYRPLDVRWLYWEQKKGSKLVEEKRKDFFQHVFDGNAWISAARKERRGYSPPVYTSAIGSFHTFEHSTSYFPVYLNPAKDGRDLFSQSESNEGDSEPVPNLSKVARRYLGDIGAEAEELFYHTISILHAPVYGNENEGALRQEWPRVPLPYDADVLHRSAELGRDVAALLDVETPVEGVDSGSIREELWPLGRVEWIDGDRSETPADIPVTAGWGYTTHGGKRVNPNDGEFVVRRYHPDEEARLPEGAIELWGAQTVDLYLNDDVRCAHVPQRVWEYELGGYRVIKKWLSYREKKVLNRNLQPEEIQHMTNMICRIAALLLLEPRLNANYEAVKAAT